MNRSEPRIIRAAGAGLATLVIATTAISLSATGSGSGVTPSDNRPTSSQPATRATSHRPAPTSGFSVPIPSTTSCRQHRQACYGQTTDTTTDSSFSLDPDPSPNVSDSPQQSSVDQPLRSSTPSPTDRTASSRGGRS
jgi:hypothetical protein